MIQRECFEQIRYEFKVTKGIVIFQFVVIAVMLVVLSMWIL